MHSKILVPPEKAGERVDVFLTGAEGIPTRSIAQKLLTDGHVTCSGKPLQKNYRVAAGDLIICALPQPQPCETQAEDIPLDILFEDEYLLVINKPRGLVVHPAAGNWQGTLVNALMHHCCGKLSGIGGVLRPGIVHRLDKDTSGAMVIAKNDAAHQGLAAQLADNSMVRIYNAVCFGAIQHDKIKIDVPIGRHPIDRKKMAIITDAGKRTREAITYVEIMERLGKYTLVSARLETGRTHQIRVHLAHVGHPVLGDTTYSNRSQPSFLKEAGQVLHAVEIGFAHPVTGEKMALTAAWPEYFQEAVNYVRQ
ncbi:MAG: RluA family pseudouridine synthase [Firmicutes bacterium]|nr:RluA family pseudouridine synthase [Bacillota bacterium]